MRGKVLELTAEIRIHRVSCPGVWLCPEGDVSLAVFALGASHQTTRLPPNFPLQYNEKLYFKEILPNVCSLTNLQSALSDETIYCELVQWKCGTKPCVLAQYLGSLVDVLFPPDTCSSDGVDLLMKTTKIFPGILAPKIEVSTKLRINELYENVGSHSPTPTSSPESARRRQSSVQRQSPVCHSLEYHRNRCRSLSPIVRKKCRITTDQDDQYTMCFCHDNTRSPDISADFIEDYNPESGRVAQLLESIRVDRRARSMDRSTKSPVRSDLSSKSPSRSRLRSARRSYIDCAGMCSICRRYHQTFHIRHS